ncbi:hypothetical protein WJX73_005408 [Symbiochloris irregularis]|uniref:DNA repair and recombination protein RAD54B n=1 Tax=Symbiochloris irregularis TaxID=706552 RepID=A0AAW1P609_9CHLO
MRKSSAPSSLHGPCRTDGPGIDNQHVNKLPVKRKGFACPAKVAKPCLTGSESTGELAAVQQGLDQTSQPQQYFTVLFAKASNKQRKNKSFQDGVLTVSADNACNLHNSEGKIVTKGKVKGAYNAPEGSEIPLGTYTLEVEDTLSEEAFRSGLVVDPYLSKHLREHQREGIQFLYDCVMAIKAPAQHGAILADEMGLGKTLQVIALLWTLLRQGPQGRPIVRKAVVAAPASLVKNWQAEVKKWLGNERLPCIALQPGPEAAAEVTSFRHGTLHRLLIVSFETLRKHASELAGSFDLLVCDEGHRLKASGGSKTIDALLSLQCRRRILLTGTPMQNNLDEFFAMVSFVNPGALGTLSTFHRVFGAAIAAARDRAATEEQKAVGEARSQELAARVASFVLRRTAQINSKYLPPLSSYVVFCKPTALQVQLYSAVLETPEVKGLLSSASATTPTVLPVISQLRKLCNSPALLQQSSEQEGLDHLFPADFDPGSTESSGKMRCLMSLVMATVEVGERLVVCSSSTQCLSLIDALCKAIEIQTVRIDGSVEASKRQDIVNSFNNYNVGKVFLLSTRAGGAGLNLVGASRLVLVDSDWNPAVDLQALGRIWRDGQTKPCVTYRLLCTGTIEEKIYQRQLAKQELAVSVASCSSAGAKGQPKAAKFTREELRQLFTLRLDTLCDTADLLSDADDSWKVSWLAITLNPVHF